MKSITDVMFMYDEGLVSRGEALDVLACHAARFDERLARAVTWIAQEMMSEEEKAADAAMAACRQREAGDVLIQV